MEKNREIGLLRGIAMCAVVGIHTFSICVSNVTSGKSAWAYLIFHSMLQFAVPCFIFISSILLSYTLYGKPLQLKKFYSKKFIRIVIPYVLWTLFYLVFKLVFRQLTFADLASLQNWWLWLGLGKAYTHLYYMSVILQLYLFTPILLGFTKLIQRIFKKFDFIAIVIIAISLQVGIYFLNRYFIYQYFKYQATMMIWYLYIILLGIWIGFNYERFKEGLKKYAVIVWGIFGVNAIIYIRYVICLKKSIKINTAWYQCNWFAYALFATLCLFWICLMLKEKNVHNKVTKAIEVVGDYSFGIYLMHPVITFVLRKVIHISQPFILLVVILISYVAMMLMCIGIIKVLKLNKWTSIIVGEYKLWQKANSSKYKDQMAIESRA